MSQKKLSWKDSFENIFLLVESEINNKIFEILSMSFLYICDLSCVLI